MNTEKSDHSPALVIKAYNHLSEAERLSLEDLYCRVFGESVTDFTWSQIDWVILVIVKGVIAAQVEIIERTVRVDTQEVKIGGVGGVGTLPEYRRRGYASLALKTAEWFIREELKASFGLLITSHELVPFYQRLGWQLLEGEVLFDQPSGKVKLEGPAMCLSCAGQDWLPGSVDLCGYPW